MREQESFSSSSWQKWVLEAIRKIRAQKQRPSVERICNAVRQHHNQSDTSIVEHLEQLVNEGHVLKVFNKGQSTYKDPGGVQSRQVVVTQDSDLTKMVVKAVKELDERDGSLLKNIEKYIRHSNSLDVEPGLDFSSVLRSTLKRAVERGLVALEGKTYRAVERAEPCEKTPKTPKRTPHEDGGESARKRRRKSSVCLIEESPKKSGLPICSECLGTASKNKTGESEELCACSECGLCVHPTCLGKARGELFLNLVGRGNTWRCEDCVTCAKCTTNAEQVCVLNCESCDSSYHLGCLEPAVDRKGKAAWKCQACLDEPGRALTHHHTQHSTPTPRINQRSLRVAHLRSLRKAARANLNWRKGKQRSGSAESSSEDAATINSIISSDLPPGVSQKDLDAFKNARERSHAVTKKSTEADIVINVGPPQPPRCPSSIEFGQYLIQTWYSSPFPQELGKLFLCEFCLKYTKSKVVLQRHLDKCNWRHPPGTEIYRHNDLSVFEVDGNVTKFYCQNLCLLAKLFLDHKTLYYDVEPFLFYVLTKNDDKGFHLVGYFSKEKHCQQKYNVSCIMTLPQYQRQGFGRFLIDFSYLLSKEEGLAGTPEKPLSDLGRVSYNAYWRSVLLEYFSNRRDGDMTLMQISKQTGLHVNDIGATLQNMNMLRVWSRDGERGCGIAIVVDWPTVDTHMQRVLASRSRIPIEPECLRWTPLISNLVNPFKGAEEEEEDDDEEEEEEIKEEVKPVVEKKAAVVEKVKDARRTREKTEKVEEPAESVEDTPVVRKGNKLKLSETPSPLVKEKTRKQRLIPELLRKQQEKANQMEIDNVKKEEEAPPELPEKRKRGPKKKWEDESMEEPLVERKRRKTGEATPIIKPSRLRLPAEPPKSEPQPQKAQPWVVRSGRVTAGNRLSLRTPPKLANTNTNANTPTKTAPASTSSLSKRAVAARARWARARAEKEEKMKQLKEEEDKKYKNEKMPELEAEEPLSPEKTTVGPGQVAEPPKLATPQPLEEEEEAPAGKTPPKLSSEKTPRRKRGWVKGVSRKGYKAKKKEHNKKSPKVKKGSRSGKKRAAKRNAEKAQEMKVEEKEEEEEEEEVEQEEEHLEDKQKSPSGEKTAQKQPEEDEEEVDVEVEKSKTSPPASPEPVEKSTNEEKVASPRPGEKPEEGGESKPEVEESGSETPDPIPTLIPVENHKQESVEEHETSVKNIPEEAKERQKIEESLQNKEAEPVVVNSTDDQSKERSIPEPSKSEESTKKAKEIDEVKEKPKDVEKLKPSPLEVDLTLGDDSLSPPKSVIQESQKIEEPPKNNLDPEVIQKSMREMPVERVREMPQERIREMPQERVREMPQERMREMPQERMREMPQERMREMPQERMREMPQERMREMPQDRMREMPQERMRELPQERISREMPQERINREIPQERISREMPQERAREMPQERVREMPQERIREMPQERVREIPQERVREMPQERVREMPQERIREMPQERMREMPQERMREMPQERMREMPQERMREMPQERLREMPQERIREMPQERVREMPQERIREMPQERVREMPQERVREMPQERIREMPQERIREMPQERIREMPQERIREMPQERIREKSNSHRVCDKRYPSPGKEKKEHEKKHPPTIVILDDVEKVKPREEKQEPEVMSGSSTPRIDNDVTAINPGSVKPAEIHSMGVYTPDSTTNSVHSMHGYSQCDLDVSQLGLESPASISSNEMPPSEQVRPPSTVAQCYTDCAQQAATLHHHHMHQYQQQVVKPRSSKTQHGSRARSTPQPASPGPPHYPHHHTQSNYIVPQGGTYVSVPVLQHRMSQQGPPQRLGPSPSCSVSTPNFYIQTAVHSQSPQPSSSLAKLQQLTNGLDTLPPGHCGTMTPPPPVDLTPPPPSHATPPPPNINYHKFYQTNVSSSTGRSSSRPVHQMSPAPPAGRSNVALNPNLMAQYSSSFNGYRVPGQQSPATVTGYITNSGFINQATQIPMQMMNMQGQYGQDPQQNTMYTYGYLNGSLMQPLNSTMRR